MIWMVDWRCASTCFAAESKGKGDTSTRNAEVFMFVCFFTTCSASFGHSSLNQYSFPYQIVRTHFIRTARCFQAITIFFFLEKGKQLNASARSRILRRSVLGPHFELDTIERKLHSSYHFRTCQIAPTSPLCVQTYLETWYRISHLQ